MEEKLFKFQEIIEITPEKNEWPTSARTLSYDQVSYLRELLGMAKDRGYTFREVEKAFEDMMFMKEHMQGMPKCECLTLAQALHCMFFEKSIPETEAHREIYEDIANNRYW